MRSRSREINVFSMSALDLFASALGAFILMSVVLMPFYLRADPDEVQQLRRALSEARRALSEARGALSEARAENDRMQDSLGQCQADLQVCEEKLSRTFIAVVIQWPTASHDVDLHLIDAVGNEFFYQQRTFPGHPGELSVDTTNGPGVEIWEVPEAPPGEYQVIYNFFSTNDNPEAANVTGGVYYRDGHIRLGERRLTEEGRENAILVAIVTVTDDGRVEVSER